MSDYNKCNKGNKRKEVVCRNVYFVLLVIKENLDCSITLFSRLHILTCFEEIVELDWHLLRVSFISTNYSQIAQFDCDLDLLSTCPCTMSVTEARKNNLSLLSALTSNVKEPLPGHWLTNYVWKAPAGPEDFAQKKTVSRLFWTSTSTLFWNEQIQLQNSYFIV